MLFRKGGESTMDARMTHTYTPKERKLARVFERRPQPALISLAGQIENFSGVTKKLNGDKKRESGGKKQFPNIVPRARRVAPRTDRSRTLPPRAQTIKIEPSRTQPELC
jgi:hypothetical protein